MSATALTTSETTGLIAGLNRMARNLWWTWNQGAQEIFNELSPRCWQNLYHNAVAVLREVSDYELRIRLQDPEFARRVRLVLHDFEAYLQDQQTWGRQNAPELIRNPVAYFSAEFGFHETLPIAAGGLGILAGDHAKSASDLDIGFVGISLFYREGYFQQTINQDNWQTEHYTLLNPRDLPLEPVLDGKGEPLVCVVDIDLTEVFFHAWKVNVGRAVVYLLDSNRPENPEHHRDLTRRVYGGDNAMRIMQEVLLGVGGVRLLRALGVQPRVFHMNEGHAAFLTLELIREKMAAGLTFDAGGRQDPGAVHLHHPHPGRGGPRPIRPGPGFLLADENHGPVENIAGRNDGAGHGWTRKTRTNFLHDRAGLETFPRGQRGERTARPGQPPACGSASGRARRWRRCPSATSPTASI